MLRQGDRLGDRASDSANFVSRVNEDFFRQIGEHQVVFGNQDLEHAVLRRGN